MLTELMNPASARRILEESIGRAVGDIEIVDVNVRDAWVVQYQAEIAGESRRVTAQRCPNGTLEKAASRVRRQAAKHHAELAGLIAARPDLEALVFPFPLDPSIERLPHAANPGNVFKHFINEAPELLNGPGRLAGCDMYVLRYVPAKRCQFRYVFPRWDAPPVQYLGKVFRDERGQWLQRAMQAVALAFIAHGDPRLTAPLPLKFMPELAMLVQEWIPGCTLHELMEGRFAVEEHMIVAARSIAVLHTSSVAPDKSYTVEDELRLIENVSDTLAGAGFPEPGHEEVLADLRRMAARLRTTRPVPVHRDFYDKQLLIDGPRTALIDVDTLALGPAEIDIASFVAHLDLRALQGVMTGDEADHWQSSFLSEYEMRAERPLDAGLFDFFLAAAYFRQACKYRVRRNGGTLSPQLLRLAGAVARGAREPRDWTGLSRRAQGGNAA